MLVLHSQALKVDLSRRKNCYRSIACSKYKFKMVVSQLWKILIWVIFNDTGITLIVFSASLV